MANEKPPIELHDAVFWNEGDVMRCGHVAELPVDPASTIALVATPTFSEHATVYVLKIEAVDVRRMLALRVMAVPVNGRPDLKLVESVRPADGEDAASVTNTGAGGSSGGGADVTPDNADIEIIPGEDGAVSVVGLEGEREQPDAGELPAAPLA